MIAFYKRIGETPLEALERLRIEKSELGRERLSYAGRLDPMAEGLLLVLVGNENKEREKYLRLDKEYEAEVLFGIETDTYDVLGKVRGVMPGKPARDTLVSHLAESIGEREMEYPPFSSKTVGGVPLFSLVRKGISVALPKRKVKVREAELLDLYEVDAKGLLVLVHDRIRRVKGDFRQKEISEAWDAASTAFPDSFAVAKIRFDVGSGFYVRTFAHEMGKVMGTGAIALSIKRTRIGDLTAND